MKPGIRYECRTPKVTVGRRRARAWARARARARGAAIWPVTSNEQFRCIRWQCNRVFWVPLLVLTKFPARLPCSSTSVSVLHVWCYIVCSCLPCALVFTHTATICICLHFNAFLVKLWLDGVELPLFSATASVLHACRYLPGCFYIPYRCYLCTLVRHHSRIGRIQFLLIWRFSLHSLYTRGLAICLSSAGCSAEYTGF